MTSMGFAQTTQSDQIKGKMDDSGQFFVEYPRPKLCHIGNSLVLHCASLLRTIFASLARAHEHVRIQNVRHFAQTKPDSEINAPFLSNEHGDP